MIEAMRSGQVHLSGLRLLVPHLTAENHREVLAEAAGKTKREIEELVAPITSSSDRQGGSDDPSNLVSLCAVHHLRGIHMGYIRVRGKAPDKLQWEVRVGAGWAPLVANAS